MDSKLYKFTESSLKVAAFDLDGTLINTISDKKFPIDKNDYKYTFDNIKDKLDKLILRKYKIVIFTNQKGISLGKVKLEDIKNKIENLFPFADYFISDKDDIYRKPLMGMYDFFITLNGKPNKIFYVGDAAGRKNDHSAVDINFAYNCNINFYTETKYFKNINDNISVSFPNLPTKTNQISDINKYLNNTIIILQGFPSSGKSSFIKDYINYHKINIDNYVHLSYDKSTTKNKFFKELKNNLLKNKLLFIDNLNASKKNRKEYIDLVPKNYTIIGIHIDTSEKISKNLNKKRYYITSQDPKFVYKNKSYKKIPNVVFSVYKKNFEKMDKVEGFHKIYNYVENIKLDYCF
jgi:bifunctional polynucleotide phosphatase/kinase